MPRRRLPVLCFDEAGSIGPFPTAVASSKKEDTLNILLPVCTGLNLHKREVFRMPSLSY